MSLDKQYAAQALAEVERASKRGFHFSNYRSAAPFLVWAGLIWFGFNLTVQLTGGYRYWNLWFLAWGIGNVVAAVLVNRHRLGKFGAYSVRATAVAWLAFGGLAALFWIAWPLSGRQVEAMIALLLSVFYAGYGLWGGMRMTAVGLVIAALTLAGYFGLQAQFPLFVGSVVGLALLVSGLWMRRV